VFLFQKIVYSQIPIPEIITDFENKKSLLLLCCATLISSINNNQQNLKK